MIGYCKNLKQTVLSEAECHNCPQVFLTCCYHWESDEERKLKQLNTEMLEVLKDLLEDAKYLYNYYPNNFRLSPEEYFKIEIDMIEKVEEMK